jgi:hypothetical protein
MATRSGVVTKPGVPDAVIAQVIALSGENLACASRPSKIPFVELFIDFVPFLALFSIDNTQTPIKSYVIVGWLAFSSTLMK